MKKEVWKILVVDDCHTTRMYLKKMLEENGYQVELSCDAAEACWQIGSNPPDIIVSDWQMPTMDGGALCQWVRGRDLPRYVYFILMTAHERFFDAVEGLDAGADDYVQKPVKIGELLARLRCGQRILRLERSIRAQCTNSNQATQTSKNVTATPST